LSVTASVTDGGTLSYQWYSNTSNNTDGGTLVGTGISYTPPTNNLGILYYYVVVTNTLGSSTAITISNTALITVNAFGNAQVPSITTQPSGETAYAIDTPMTGVTALSVTTTVGDGGTLSYQWYSNTIKSNNGGTVVSGATNFDFKPSTVIAGTRWYYVVITNTIFDNGDGGNKKASVSSDTVLVTVIGSVADVTTHLAAVSSGTSTANPVKLPLPAAIGMANNWTVLLTAIQGGNKYVALDLSACSMSGVSPAGEFNPDNTKSTGKSWIVSLVLPNAATSIKDGNSSVAAFGHFTNLRELNGANITVVGLRAFEKSFFLTSVNLPRAKTIGHYAFYYCRNLASINVSEATTIGSYAFGSCTALTSINLPEATTIDSYAFGFCTTLTGIDLPEVTDVGGNVFEGCSLLSSANLPKATGVPGFKDCHALTSIYLPEATQISDEAFLSCIALSSVNIPKATSVGRRAFRGCTSLSSVNLPKAALIFDYAFENCTTFTSISLPEATSIYTYAFKDCSSLSSVNLPEVTEIRSYAFEGCTALSSLNLPKVTDIRSSAFVKTGSTALTVTLPAAPPKVEKYIFDSLYTAVVLKTVTVKAQNITSGLTGYGSEPINTTTPNWGNAFRGMGWNGSLYLGNQIDARITLVYENP
jgi:hypothetical protein